MSAIESCLALKSSSTGKCHMRVKCHPERSKTFRSRNDLVAVEGSLRPSCLPLLGTLRLRSGCPHVRVLHEGAHDDSKGSIRRDRRTFVDRLGHVNQGRQHVPQALSSADRRKRNKAGCKADRSVRRLFVRTCQARKRGWADKLFACASSMLLNVPAARNAKIAEPRLVTLLLGTSTGRPNTFA